MLKFPGKIPITIYPFFWVTSALIGFLYSGSLLGTFFWMGVILFSVLIHELGHALTALFFKQKTKIDLVALGGLTSFEGPSLSFGKQFLITLNGPLFGFFLFLGATLLLQFPWGPSIFMGLKMIQLANLFWTIMNLLPVLPLDGGQLLRIGLEAFFGVKGLRLSYLIGGILSSCLGLGFLILQSILIAAIFFLFAAQSFASWKNSALVAPSDRRDENKELMVQAEEALSHADKTKAKELLETLLQKVSTGILAISARQYLAFLYFQEGESKKSYDLLLPIKEHLTDDALCLLQDLAEAQKNVQLVAELSSICYQSLPSQEVALRNARAFAHLKQAEEAGGWLQTAWQFGRLDLSSILQEKDFQDIANDPSFQESVQRLQ